jgi:hypothetical protein
MRMNLYLISQNATEDKYDVFDSAVVAAENEEIAKNMNPGNGKPIDWNNITYYSWCNKIEDVSVKYLGKADDSISRGVICGSYNAS